MIRLRTLHAAAMIAAASLWACADMTTALQDATSETNAVDLADPHRAEANLIEGVRYLSGDGVPADTARAAELIRAAADAGNADAQYLVGVTHVLRPTSARDDAVAVEWLSRAAVQGHKQAQFALAEAYANGTGVTPEPEWANMWYERAARQGHREAQFALASRKLVGEGTMMDRAAAYRWYALAAAAGHPLAARNRDALGKRLRRTERQRIDSDVKGWKPASETAFSDTAMVRFVQLGLAQNGYDTGGVDGRMGPRTREALHAFAAQEGLARGNEITPDYVVRLRELLRERG